MRERDDAERGRAPGPAASAGSAGAARAAGSATGAALAAGAARAAGAATAGAPAAGAATAGAAATAAAGAAAAAAAWLRGEVSLAALRGYSDEELGAVADLGYLMFRRGRLEQAATIFEGLAALTGGEYPLRALAAIAVARQRFADALPLLAAAVARRPAGLEARLLRAEALHRLGRYAEAQTDLEWIVRAAPRDADEEAQRRRAAALLRRLVRPGA